MATAHLLASVAGVTLVVAVADIGFVKSFATSWSSCVVVMEDPTQDTWTLLRPLLPHVSIARLAKTARVSTRMAKAYRRGEKAPSPRTLRRLLPLLWRVAGELCEHATPNGAEQLRTRQAVATLERLMAHHGLTVR